MKKSSQSLVLVLLLLLAGSCGPSASTKNRSGASPSIECKYYSWEKVLQLVEPWFDDFLYTQLVMQGQSSHYKTSEAAGHALGMKENLPEDIQGILKALVKADC